MAKRMVLKVERSMFYSANNVQFNVEI